LFTAPAENVEASVPALKAEHTEPADIHEANEPALATEPIDPKEFREPMLSMLLREAIDSIESVDQSDSGMIPPWGVGARQHNRHGQATPVINGVTAPRGRAGELDPHTATILERELSGGVRFFWEQANNDPSSPGFGLIPDRWGHGRDPLGHDARVASVAATGFGLSALAIGAARGLIPHEAARDRARRTLATLARVPAHRGFLAHYVDMATGARHKLSEYSTIDTALALNGAITVAGYFADPEISERASALLAAADWGWLTFRRGDRLLLAMACNPDRGGDYAGDADAAGMIGAWDMTAEQLCMYLLAAGHPGIDAGVARELYHGFDRPMGSWGGRSFVHTPGGAMFIYQFSQAWLPFQDYRDDIGFDWFANSTDAILANRAWCIDHHQTWRTLSEHLWGLTAGDGLESYIVSGTPVSGDPLVPYVEGTVHPYAMVAALPFVPALAADSLRHLDAAHPCAWGPYGFVDAINLEGTSPVYIPTVLGIDKGPALLMVDNYLHATTWDAYSRHPWITAALAKLGWSTAAGVRAATDTPPPQGR
jgi:hypothetical protein